MPRPLGRDRIAGVREGKLLLSCAEPKGWRVRVPKAAPSAEHPGTCVRWEEQLFEVEDLEIHADGSLTYTLAPWDDRHAIRPFHRTGVIQQHHQVQRTPRFAPTGGGANGQTDYFAVVGKRIMRLFPGK